jgi:hypothetical protein
LLLLLLLLLPLFCPLLPTWKIFLANQEQPPPLCCSCWSCMYYSLG